MFITYLLEAGYPEGLINILKYDKKLEFYQNQYFCDSVGITYGIFTEEYRIEYTLDGNGNIIIDGNNSVELKKLLADEYEIAKILNAKDKAEKGDISPYAYDAVINEDEYAQLVEEANLRFLAENAQLINSLQTGAPENSILALSNWTGAIYCNYLSYSGGVARRSLMYTWEWNYRPVWHFTDKVGMAWSGDFTGEPTTFEWCYIYSCTSNIYGSVSGRSYVDYDTNIGVGTNISLVSTFVHPGTGVTYQSLCHSGYIMIELTKLTNVNSRESAVGTYYHKQLIATIGSLSFSKSGPSISVIPSTNYDKAVDSAVAFWAMTS